MNELKITQELLEAYFNDRCTEQEAAAVERWMSLKQQGDESVSCLNAIFDKIDRRNDKLANRAYRQCARKLKFPEGDDGESAPGKWRPRLLWAAAAIALVLLTLQVGRQIALEEEETPPVPELIEVYAARGSSQTIILPDSTTIILKSGSHLIYPERFEGQVRKIWLSGECYASVTRKENQPFILSTGTTEIRVLGTEFNVKAYPEDSEAEVALVRGSVIVDRQTTPGTVQSISMAPGNVVKIDRSNGEMRINEFDVAPYTAEGKKEDAFIFLNQRFCDIVSELSRRMNVDILLSDEQIGARRFYSYFVNGESLDDMLKIFNSDGSMEIIREGKIIKINAAAIR